MLYRHPYRSGPCFDLLFGARRTDSTDLVKIKVSAVSNMFTGHLTLLHYARALELDFAQYSPDPCWYA